MTSGYGIFNRILPSSSISYCNSAIKIAVDNGFSQNALLVFKKMKQFDIQPDKLTFTFLSKACSRMSHYVNSQIIHASVVKSPFSHNVFVLTAMVDMYLKCDHLHIAQDMFDKMPVRDIVSWNAMILGFSQLGLSSKAFDLLHRMRLENFKPDSVTIISLTQLGSKTESLVLTKSVHGMGVSMGYDSDISIVNTWISSYTKCGDLGSAEFIFNSISSSLRSVVSWNSMIAGYTHLNIEDKAISSYQRMLCDGMRPDLSTFLSLLSSCSHSDSLVQGKLIHSHAIIEGFVCDVALINTLISMYCKCGDIVAARYFFDTMPKRTCVSWTVMISGYAQKGDINEACNLFYAMKEAGVEPDEVAIVAILAGCSQMGALKIGKSINQYILDNGFIRHVMVCNALVDMYAKCGSIHDARRIFDAICAKNVISWTTMISGYAMNGRSGEALQLFSEMLDSGLKPNHVTFLAIFQACTHGGYLTKGFQYFNLMIRTYHITPILEHYACMADLLGRMGKIKEALEFIQNMCVEPDAGVWGALLGSCQTHREVKIAEFASSQLFELESHTAVSYVAMANIYAAEGRWDGVASIRTMMKNKNIKKCPGQSIVEVDGKVHSFVVEDKSHPSCLEIYAMLEGLALLLKEEGLSINIMNAFSQDLD